MALGRLAGEVNRLPPALENVIQAPPRRAGFEQARSSRISWERTVAQLAGRKRKEAEARPVDPATDAAVLDEETVLRHLEAGAVGHDDGDVLRGLRNGSLIAALFWLALLGILFAL
jgi:hypothetical protein